MFENMTEREKRMGIAVAALLPLFLIFFAWTSITGNLTKKNREIELLTVEQRKLETQELKGSFAVQRYEKYRQSSLPSDADDSVNDYYLWLQELARELEIKEFSVQPKNRRDPKKLLNEVRLQFGVEFEFEVTKCECTLKQLTNFVYRINQTDLLHRIWDLKITPRMDGTGNRTIPNGTLGVNLKIQVVCLDDADKVREYKESTIDLARSLDEYHNIVTRRDVFGLPNSAPNITTVGTHQFDLGDNVTINLNASDDDQNQDLTWEVSEVQADLVNDDDEFRLADDFFDSERGKVELGQLSEGDFEFTAKVKDNGWGSKSAEKRINISVVAPDPPPSEPAPRLEARDTYISSKIITLGVPRVIIDIRPAGKKPELGEGDSFELDQKTWTITKIDGLLVTIDVDGESLVFKVRSSLANPEPAGAE